MSYTPHAQGMDSKSFVATLELDEYESTLSSPACGSGVLPVDGTRQGFVDEGSLVCFTSDVHSQQKEDVLESTLLAQLAANKKYDRFADPKNWYKFYNKVLEEVGWVAQGFEPFVEYITNLPDAFKISDVVLELYSGVLGDEMEKVVKDTIGSLEQSTQGLTLLDSSGSSEKNGNFQILPCTVDKSNQVSVAFLGFYFNSSKILRDFFFEKVKKSDVHLFKSDQVFTLNEDQYSQVREEVKKKLGERVKKYVNNLLIG